MIILILVLAVLISGGCLFILPAYISFIRQQAQQSTVYRRWLIAILSFTAFIVFYALLGLFLVFLALMSACDLRCPERYYQQENLIDYEIWLHMMIPPYVADNVCISGNTEACQFVQDYVMHYDRTQVFFFMLGLALIPALICGFLVLQITRDDRKVKND